MPEDPRDVRKPLTPPAGVLEQLASPVAFDKEDLTGQYATDPAQLLAARRTRSPSERVEHLEGKHDSLDKTVTAMRVDVGLIKGTLNGQQLLLEDIRGVLKAERIVETAERKATIDDKLDAKKARRKLLTKIGTAILGVVGVVVGHYILARLGL